MQAVKLRTNKILQFLAGGADLQPAEIWY